MERKIGFASDYFFLPLFLLHGCLSPDFLLVVAVFPSKSGKGFIAVEGGDFFPDVGEGESLFPDAGDSASDPDFSSSSSSSSALSLKGV